MLWLTYILLLVVFLIASFSNIRQGRMLFSALAIVLLAVLAGGRLDYGVDYDEYLKIFESVPRLSEFFSSNALIDIHGEYLFLFFCSVVKSVGLGFEAFSIIFSLLSVSVTICAFYQFGLGVTATVLLYFCHNFLLKEMGQIRNGLSSAVLLLAFYNLQKGKKIRYLASVVLATLIHQAAGIFLLAYFAINRSFAFLFGSLFVAFVFGAVGWLDLFLQSASSILPNALILYVSTEYYSNIGLSNPQTVKQGILCLLFYFLFIEFSKDKYSTYSLNVLQFGNFVKIYILSVFFLFIFVEFDILARRLASYFSIFEPIMFAQCLYFMIKTRKKLYYYFFVVFLTVYASSSAIFNLAFREGFDGQYNNWIFSKIL